jgi:hypothetical protein
MAIRVIWNSTSRPGADLPGRTKMISGHPSEVSMTHATQPISEAKNRDAKLLADHKRFASAFALAVLGIEEIGKVVLDLWGRAGPLSKPVVRRTVHIR